MISTRRHFIDCTVNPRIREGSRIDRLIAIGNELLQEGDEVSAEMIRDVIRRRRSEMNFLQDSYTRSLDVPDSPWEA